MNLEKISKINYVDSYNLNEPYPEITLTHLPQDILMKIKRIYVGAKGEFTSITQYMYQHFVIWSNPKLNHLSSAMEQIAVKEMVHYELLAKILVRCGIDPKNCIYIDGNPNVCDYWKASSVSYEKTLIKMFEDNLKLEQIAIRDYTEILQNTDSQNLKEILERIIKDEKLHETFFMDILNELKN